MSEYSINKNYTEIVKELSPEKQFFIIKHSLIITEHMFWITIKENSFPRKICRHQFMINSDIPGLLFRINEICFAKLKYFRANLTFFDPYIFDIEKGFQKTELWDAEFFRHIPSGLMIDLRYLNKIKEIDDFREFCLYIEKRASGDYDKSDK